MNWLHNKGNIIKYENYLSLTIESYKKPLYES